MQLTGGIKNLIMNMRNGSCVGTQTLKVPTRLALLFTSYSVHGFNMNNMFIACVFLVFVSTNL